MSVQDLFDFQQNVLKDWLENPRCWILVANPVWGSYETINRIAIFDTKELAKAYIEASRLPESTDPDKYKTDDGYVRTFRPDSLLWDYNDERRCRVLIPLPWEACRNLVANPVPPSGHILNGPREWSPHGIPALSDFATDKPRYGKDYDQGCGGPYTDMNHVVPEPPPAAGPT